MKFRDYLKQMNEMQPYIPVEKTGLLQRIWIGKTEQHAPRIKVDNPTNSIGKNGVGVDILGKMLWKR